MDSDQRKTQNQLVSPIIVLGMHRSGTSYLASVLGAMGIHLGSNLLEAAPDNPKGFFEDSDFVTFHSQLLTRILPEQGAGSPVGNILVRNLEPVELLPEERERALQIIAERQQRAVWGWKDPRTCLLLDFWLEQFPAATLVAVYRHPLEVYASILRRQRLQVMADEPLLIDTWTEYNRRILQVWDQHPGRKILIGAGECFRNPEMLAQRIDAELGMGLTLSACNLPVFETTEFHQLPICRGVNRCFSTVFEEAGRVFDELQRLADVPLCLPEANDGIWNALLKRLSGGSIPVSSAISILADLLSAELGELRRRSLRTAVVTAVEKSRECDELVQQLRSEQPEFVRHQRAVTAAVTELTEWRAQYLVKQTLEIGSRRDVFLWGNNPLSRRVRTLLGDEGIPVVAVIDKNEDNSVSPDSFIATLHSQGMLPPWVIVCSRSARDDISSILRQSGLDPKMDFVVLPNFPISATS